jgi:outer membrane protein OmpA-like peptidoglycan-associated protein
MRPKILIVLMSLLLLVLAVQAEAQVGYNGTKGLIRTRSADVLGKGTLNFQLSGYYYRMDDHFQSEDVDYHFIISRVALTYSLSDYMEIAANLDIRNWIRRPQQSGTSLDTYTRGGVGDTDVLGKISVPLPTPHLKLGALGGASFPTGSKDRGFTTNSTDFLLEGLATLDLTDWESFVPTRVHVNLGYRWNRNEDDGYGVFSGENPSSSGFPPPSYPGVPAGESNAFNDLFIFNSAVEFPAPQVTFFVEFNWENLIGYSADLGDSSASVYTITPGLALISKGGTALKLAGDINVNLGDHPPLVGAPDWALWLSISQSTVIIPKDSDHDGISDKDDACPDEPEDLDGYQDDDGCPDPDNDGDGILDVDDKCPDLAEDKDGFEDEDGCPDLDNDQDGIPDVKDKCPNQPEDFDGDRDDDGCPDLVKDSDNDGIPDDVDRCPLQAEDLDGFQDDDGCPDLDNDLDGIPDAQDNCPNAPETFNGYMDEDGCPDEKPIEKKFILKGIHFESGSAALTPDSYPILDEVVRSMLAYPEVRVEIRGYTDSVGSASYNLGLSQRRADSVKQYLVNAGIDPARMAAKGYGEADPVGSNDTPGGRASNRRIEFHRLN